MKLVPYFETERPELVSYLTQLKSAYWKAFMDHYTGGQGVVEDPLHFDYPHYHAYELDAEKAPVRINDLSLEDVRQKILRVPLLEQVQEVENLYRYFHHSIEQLLLSRELRHEQNLFFTQQSNRFFQYLCYKYQEVVNEIEVKYPNYHQLKSFQDFFEQLDVLPEQSAGLARVCQYLQCWLQDGFLYIPNRKQSYLFVALKETGWLNPKTVDRIRTEEGKVINLKTAYNVTYQFNKTKKTATEKEHAYILTLLHKKTF